MIVAGSPVWSRMSNLIVTNGDSGAERMRDAGLGDEILCWRDMLHEGPVPLTANTAALTNLRANFLTTVAPGRKVSAELYQRDRVLAGSGLFKEVVIWFEHDLYDQLQLIQVLAQLGQRSFKDTKISMISAPRYVGTLVPDEALTTFATRSLVEEPQFELAERAWAAFRAATPQPLLDFLRTDELSSLPFLEAALRRLLEEYPGNDGLARSERQILQALQTAGGTLGARDLYRRSHHDMEDPVWLGDWPFAMRLQLLSRSKKPAIALKPSAESTEEHAEIDGAYAAELNSEVALTEYGSDLLAGKADFVKDNGIDRWLGGVHLTRDNLWRWDNESKTVSKK